MAEKFNLLPKNEEKKNSKIDVLLQRIAIVTFLILVMVLAGFSLALFMFSRKLSSINLEVKQNKANIASLESAESGLLIVKDRAQKLSGIVGLRENERVFDKYLEINKSSPDTIEFKNIDLNDANSTITFQGSNSKDFSDFIDWLMINADEFDVLYANSLGLSERGYLISLEAK